MKETLPQIQEPDRLTPEQMERRLAALAEMDRLREAAIADGMRLWSQEEVNEYVRRIRSGEPTDDLE